MALKRENPDRTAAEIRADPAHPAGLGARRTHPAAQLPPARRSSRRRRRGRRAVFGRFEAEQPERPVDRRRAARPATSAAARRICSRSSTTIPGWSRAPVGLRRGHRAAGRRAAPGAGLPRRPQGRSTSTTARRSSTRGCCGRARNSGSSWCIPHPVGPQGRGKIETVLPDRARAVPGRDHRRARRRSAATTSPTWPS